MKKQTNHKRYVKPYSQLTFMQKFRRYVCDSKVYPSDLLECVYSAKDREKFNRYIGVIHYRPYTVHTRINYRNVGTTHHDWNVKHLQLEKMWQMWVVEKPNQHKGRLNEKINCKAS
uniref:Uncharacterized protein n=2 Tax=Vibrionaceae TaxID=641 RepID=A0A0H3ZV13_VIBSP|nr:hypothetical protein [Vibrio splendidus]AKN40586.1 hypothetical protein [Enterovibrio norvegicus]